MLPGRPSRPYLVFTSAGDRSNVRRWVQGERSFDLWVTYYGEQPGALADVADLYNCRQGSKFQNLHHVHRTWPDLLQAYEAVLVMDDDILIRAEEITRLFEIRRELDLWLLQPAFSPWGKVSHPLTRVVRTERWRYTNFVEMTCPLFRGDKLSAFLRAYDPVLVGWGIDWWFLDALGPDLERRVAVIDEVVCTNPRDADKGGQREIDRLQSKDARKAVWDAIKRTHHIGSEERRQAEYGRVPRAWPGRLWGSAFMAAEHRAVRAVGLGRRVMRTLSPGGGARGVLDRPGSRK